MKQIANITDELNDNGIVQAEAFSKRIALRFCGALSQSNYTGVARKDASQRECYEGNPKKYWKEQNQSA